jgi:hypothetical protein
VTLVTVAALPAVTRNGKAARLIHAGVHPPPPPRWLLGQPERPGSLLERRIEALRAIDGEGGVRRK